MIKIISPTPANTPTTINVRLGTLTKLKTLQRKYNFTSISEVIKQLLLFWVENGEEFSDIELQPTIYCEKSPASLKRMRITSSKRIVAYLKEVKKDNEKTRGRYRIRNLDETVSALINYHKDVRYGMRTTTGFHTVPQQ